MNNIEEKLKRIKIKEKLMNESKDSIWKFLETKYINYYNSKMLSNSSQSVLKAKPKWLIALMISGITLIIIALPVSAYFVIPAVHENVNRILQINEAQEGTLTVNTTSPTSVLVFVNGEFYGTTPLSVTLPVGSYTVRLYKEGYQESYETVTISNSQEAVISTSLGELSSNTNTSVYKEWLSYRNDEVGFGFQYPNNWIISESANGSQKTIKLKYEKDSVTVYDFTVLYEAKNTNAYNESKLIVAETSDDEAGKVKILTRKVGSTVVDTLTLIEKSLKDTSNLSNEELSARDLFIDSVNFVNRTQSSSNGTSSDSILYKEATLIAAPHTSSGNYLLTDDIALNKTQILNVNSKTIKNFAYNIPEQFFIVDPKGEFAVYNQNSIVYAMDLANGKTVELFRGKSDSNIQFTFGFDSISPDSNYLVYKVTIHDISECSKDRGNGSCLGKILDEKYGWKTGVYVYDLSGKLGNQYLYRQPFDKSFYDDNDYIVDWTNNSLSFYIEDVSHSRIYKYYFDSNSFIKAGEAYLGDYACVYLDMWEDGRYSDTNIGILRIIQKNSDSYQLWKVTDGGVGAGGDITKVSEIDLGMLPRKDYPYQPKIISLDGKPYVFFDNSIWMYSLLEENWQAFKFLGSDSTYGPPYITYYQTSVSNNVLFVETWYGEQQYRASGSNITLFNPQNLTITKQFGDFSSALAPSGLEY